MRTDELLRRITRVYLYSTSRTTSYLPVSHPRDQHKLYTHRLPLPLTQGVTVGNKPTVKKSNVLCTVALSYYRTGMLTDSLPSLVRQHTADPGLRISLRPLTGPPQPLARFCQEKRRLLNFGGFLSLPRQNSAHGVFLGKNGRVSYSIIETLPKTLCF